MKIMPLGDSITAGYTDNPEWNHPFKYGYRGALYHKLISAGYSFEYVGCSEEPFDNRFGDPNISKPLDLKIDLNDINQNNHRGYGGWKIEQLEEHIVEWLRVDKPDLILLMIGINGISVNSPNLLDSLVATIFNTSPNVKIIVAQITPLINFNNDIINYNIFIKNILVPKFEKMGFWVRTVDQYSNFLTNSSNLESIHSDFFSNNINHPTNACYEKIADTWFQGIQINISNIAQI